jgi:hypothetical protein
MKNILLGKELRLEPCSGYCLTFGGYIDKTSNWFRRRIASVQSVLTKEVELLCSTNSLSCITSPRSRWLAALLQAIYLEIMLQFDDFLVSRSE